MSEGRLALSVTWYRELMIMSIRRFTSAWNSYVSSPSRFTFLSLLTPRASES